MMPYITERQDIREAEHQVMASAEIIAEVYAHAGITAQLYRPLLDRLAAAVCIWKELLMHAGLDSDTNGYLFESKHKGKPN